MICTCSCDINADTPELIEDTYPIARKPHICCECGEEIPIGAKYERTKGKWAGDWSTYKTCMPCRAIREDFCDCWIYEGLQEAIWECLGFNYVTNEMNPIHEEDSRLQRTLSYV